MSSISRVLVRAYAALLACSLAGLAAFSDAAADPAALPRPRGEEWWFIFWDIDNRV